MKSLPILAFFLSISTFQTLFSQEQLGLRFERFSGIWATETNPAAVSFNPLKWDVNLFQIDGFGENSYAFLSKTSLIRAARHPEKLNSMANEAERHQPSRDQIMQDFFLPKRKMHGIGQGRFSGPGFSFKIKDQHTIGITTTLRFQVSSYKIPTVLAFETINNRPLNTDVVVKPFKLSAASWAEIGFLYAFNTPDNGDPILSFGIMPKILMGIEGGYGRLEREVVYQQTSPKDFLFETGHFNYGTTNSNFNSIETQSIKPKINGFGGAVNLGFSYSMPDENSDMDMDYKWRSGFSIIDLGFINFNKNAEQHDIDFNESTPISSTIFNGIKTPRDFINTISQNFLKDSIKSLSDNRFSIGLPASVSVQFDYKIYPKFYVSSIATQRISIAKNNLSRPNSIAVIPRFESRFLSASLPLILNDYRTFRMGFAARLGFLVLGTDNLGWLREKNTQAGADFYLGLKINGFKLKLSDIFGGLSRRNRTWKKVGCYVF